MFENRRLKGAVAAVALLAGGTALSSCAEIEERTGIGREAQIGAGAGAATGGVLAGIAGANPGWIAASAILGGVAGGVLGEYISRRDVERHASTQYTALDTLGPGESRNWQGEDGTSGQTTVTEVFRTADGTLCKNFTETITTPQRTFNEQGTACQTPQGGWQVRTA